MLRCFDGSTAWITRLSPSSALAQRRAGDRSRDESEALAEAGTVVAVTGSFIGEDDDELVAPGVGFDRQRTSCRRTGHARGAAWGATPSMR